MKTSKNGRTEVDCISFLPAVGRKKPMCRALREAYCLFEDKPCPFRAPIPERSPENTIKR